MAMAHRYLSNGGDSRPDVSRVAAIYVRVSTTMQEDNFSPAVQRQECLTHAVQHRYTVPEDLIVEDIARSSVTLERAGLQRLLQAAREGRYGVLLVYRLDRLSRDQLQAGVLRYELKQAGVRLESTQEQLPEDTLTAELLSGVYSYTAALARQTIATNTAKGRAQRVREGKLLPSGIPLYGYQWTDPSAKYGKGSYELDPITSETVKRIFDLYLQGMPAQAIAKQLTLENALTPGQRFQERNGPHASHKYGATFWSTTAVHRILVNETYTGKHTVNRYKHTKRQELNPLTGKVEDVRYQERRADTDPAVTVISVPAIVSEEQYATAQIRLAYNKQAAARHNSDPTAFLLRGGYAVCGHCGANMRAMNARSKKAGATASGKPSRAVARHYRCGSGRGMGDTHAGINLCSGGSFSIVSSELDGKVWQAIRTILNDPAIITKAIEDLHSARADADTEAIQQAKNLAGRKNELEGIVSNISSEIGRVQSATARAALTQRLDMAATELEAIKSEEVKQEHDAQRRSSASEQLLELERLTSVWSTVCDTLSYAQRRQLLFALGARVTVWNTKHSPRWQLNLTFDGLNSGVNYDGLLTLTDQDIAEIDTKLELLRAGGQVNDGKSTLAYNHEQHRPGAQCFGGDGGRAASCTGAGSRPARIAHWLDLAAK